MLRLRQNPLLWALLGLSLVSCSGLQTSEFRLQGQGAHPAQQSQSSHRTTNMRGFHWPVEQATLTQRFRAHAHSGRRKHLGIDLAASRGTPLLAAHSGTVIYTGADFSGFGKMVLIESDGGGEWASLYAHCDKIYVTEGQRVVLGDVIASMGNTGRTTGVHLHFELRKDKVAVDPLDYLPKPIANRR